MLFFFTWSAPPPRSIFHLTSSEENFCNIILKFFFKAKSLKNHVLEFLEILKFQMFLF